MKLFRKIKFVLNRLIFKRRKVRRFNKKLQRIGIVAVRLYGNDRKLRRSQLGQVINNIMNEK